MNRYRLLRALLLVGIVAIGCSGHSGAPESRTQLVPSTDRSTVEVVPLQDSIGFRGLHEMHVGDHRLGFFDGTMLWDLRVIFGGTLYHVADEGRPVLIYLCWDLEDGGRLMVGAAADDDMPEPHEVTHFRVGLRTDVGGPNACEPLQFTLGSIQLYVGLLPRYWVSPVQSHARLRIGSAADAFAALLGPPAESTGARFLYRTVIEGHHPQRVSQLELLVRDRQIVGMHGFVM